MILDSTHRQTVESRTLAKKWPLWAAEGGRWGSHSDWSPTGLPHAGSNRREFREHPLTVESNCRHRNLHLKNRNIANLNVTLSK